jgi:hypothetical protein
LHNGAKVGGILELGNEDFNTTAAQAMGQDDVKSSLERYEAAHEYMDLCYQFVTLPSQETPDSTDILQGSGNSHEKMEP